ncbi:MAG: putative quinol monooxygenase [Herpetosiphon sp.]
MAPLTIIAKLKAIPGAEDELYAACRKLIAPTRAEEGCMNYDMHRSIEDHNTIMFYENWTTKPLWEQHMKSAHIAEFSEATRNIQAVWELFQGEKVDS